MRPTRETLQGQCGNQEPALRLDRLPSCLQIRRDPNHCSTCMPGQISPVHNSHALHRANIMHGQVVLSDPTVRCRVCSCLAHANVVCANGKLAWRVQPCTSDAALARHTQDGTCALTCTENLYRGPKTKDKTAAASSHLYQSCSMKQSSTQNSAIWKQELNASPCSTQFVRRS